MSEKTYLEPPKRASTADVIGYKREKESEAPGLSAEPRLITVDGPDGSGKSTVAKILAERLREKLGKDKVVFVDITNLKGGVGAERLGSALEKLTNPSPERVDQFYAAGVNRMYGEVIIPALNKGQIVVVDRSEVDLLRFSHEVLQKKQLVGRRHKSIADGTLTHGLWAGARVFVNAPPEDIWANLQRRGTSEYDPQDIEEVRRRAQIQRETNEEILAMDCKGPVKVIRRENKKVDPDSLEKHLNQIVTSIIAELPSYN